MINQIEVRELGQFTCLKVILIIFTNSYSTFDMGSAGVRGQCAAMISAVPVDVGEGPLDDVSVPRQRFSASSLSGEGESVWTWTGSWSDAPHEFLIG